MDFFFMGHAGTGCVYNIWKASKFSILGVTLLFPEEEAFCSTEQNVNRKLWWAFGLNGSGSSLFIDASCPFPYPNWPDVQIMRWIVPDVYLQLYKLIFSLWCSFIAFSSSYQKYFCIYIELNCFRQSWKIFSFYACKVIFITSTVIFHNSPE